MKMKHGYQANRSFKSGRGWAKGSSKAVIDSGYIERQYGMVFHFPPFSDFFVEEISDFEMFEDQFQAQEEDEDESMADFQEQEMQIESKQVLCISILIQRILLTLPRILLKINLKLLNYFKISRKYMDLIHLDLDKFKQFKIY